MANIVMVSNYSSDTGYAWWLMEHFWRTLSERLPESSQAYLAYPKVTAVSQSLLDAGINVIELNFATWNNADMKAVLNFIKKHKIQTVYFSDRSYFSAFYLLLRFYGVKTIIVHDHTPGDRPPIVGLKGVIKSLRNRLPFFTVDLFINVSPLMRERSIRNGRIPSEKCVSVQNGLPVEQYATGRKQGENIRQSLNIDSSAALVVCSSRLHEYKNVQFAINVFATNQADKQSDTHMLIIGDGPYEAELKTLTSKQACKDRIHFLGFRSDVKDILQQCDLAFHCSRGEGFSLSIIEFMWSGLPVLVPDVPSVCQAIISGSNGLIYRNNDLEDATDKLNLILEDREMRECMGETAKKTVLEYYTMKTTDSEFSNALQKVGI
ncbi:MAG: glycosyltransferase family 4 protein [Saccharospirillum sp.]|nr:glycosyltransferase family 4 protein [Saccharospirillum sp.]